MPEAPITINVNLKDDDLADFYLHNARKSILMKMLIACALITFFSQLVRIILQPESLDRACLWVVGVIALFFMMYYSNKHNAKKEFKRNKRLQEGHIYVISEESIHIQGGPFNTIFNWDKLYDMTESNNSFFIWLSKESVQIIPKRDMTVDEIDRVKALRKSKIQK